MANIGSGTAQHIPSGQEEMLRCVLRLSTKDDILFLIFYPRWNALKSRAL